MTAEVNNNSALRGQVFVNGCFRSEYRYVCTQK